MMKKCNKNEGEIEDHEYYYYYILEVPCLILWWVQYALHLWNHKNAVSLQGKEEI